MALGSAWEWRTFTSMFNITHMSGGHSHVWCGTEGGLLAFDPLTDHFSIWTNTEGLASNNVTAIHSDINGRIGIGFDNGHLQLYDPDTFQWILIDDYQGNQVTCFAVTGDTLFVGLDIGVSLYLISRAEVKETYHNLGFRSSEGNYLTDIPVNDVLLSGNEIWVATNEGVAYSWLENRNLLDPTSWVQSTGVQGLPDKSVTSLAFIDENMYAGTSKGVAEWDGQEWHVRNGSDVYDLTIHNNQLYVAANNGVFFLSGEQWHYLEACPYTVTSLTSSFSSLWGATEKGLCVYTESVQTWDNYIPNTLSSNLITALSVDNDGFLWCCSRDKGFFRYDGMNWDTYDPETIPGLRSNYFVSTVADQSNNKWFGSWGHGLVSIKSDSAIYLYNAENGYLAGVSEDADYAVVPDMAVDSHGTVWILNYRSLTNLPLVAVTPDSDWIYFGLADDVTSTFLRVITVDLEGRKWIGSDSEGIFIVDDNGTPSDKTDDLPVRRLTVSDGLETNEISALAVDREGGVWIGTPEGLHYYFIETLSRRYGLPSENITALVADGANNIWIGTSDGLCMFSEETYEYTIFTEENSGLVNNKVNTLMMDSNTGILFIGTSNGLSSLETPFSDPRAELRALFIYPNPFILKEHNNLVIDELAKDVSVHVFSSSGFLVRRFSLNEVKGRRLLWDGKNQEGEPVSGGIYLIVASTEEGNSSVGKVAIVR